MSLPLTGHSDWHFDPLGSHWQPGECNQQCLLTRGHARGKHSTKHFLKIPTRDTSLLIGCNVGSSGINPAATMGIMAVKILVRKVQTQKR